MSGYFLFLGKHRPIVRAANTTATIGEIGKLLGVKWSSLSDVDKAVFTDKAAEAKAKHVEVLAKWKQDMVEFVAKGGILASSGNKDPRDSVFPQATIKKIMKKDKDVSNMSKEALFLMTKCTDLFVEFLGEASIRQAYGQKRKSVRMEDINAAIRATSSARFLEPDFPITGPSNHKRQKIDVNDSSPQSVAAGPMDAFFKSKKIQAPQVEVEATKEGNDDNNNEE